MHNHMVPHHARVVHRETAVRSIASVNEATNVNEAVQQRRAARKRFQAHYRALYDELLEILFQIDPIGVHGSNTEKFVPELATILPRLPDARSPEDVEQIIQEELRRWYGRRRLGPPGSGAANSRHDRDQFRLESLS